MKLMYVVGFSMSAKGVYDDNKVAVDLFDPSLAGTFETIVWVPQINAVTGMLSTRNLMQLDEGKTILRDGFLDAMIPVLKNLDYKLDLCIAAGTITDSKGSFGLGNVLKGINKRNLYLFHLSYVGLMARIAAGGNTAALVAKGFTAPMILSITTQHDLVWDLVTEKIDLEVDISDLSAADKVIVKAVMKTNMRVIKAMHAMAVVQGNTVLKKKCTKKAILSMVTPAVAPGPVDREIKQNESICWLVKPTQKELLEMTLLTEGGSAKVCRQNLKTGVCSAGIDLVYNTKVSKKKMEIPGVGDKIIITNTGTKKIKVRCGRVK
ncbi:MAG: hypothetical protein WCL14_05595 [Bacteroidota bacterium]